MPSIARKRIRFSPILITSLVALVLTALFSVSELVGFLGITIGACLTLAIFGTDMVEKRIFDNIEKAREKAKEKAKKTGTVGKRKLRVLNWPKDSLRQGTLYWGLASFFFAIQIATDEIAPYLLFPDTYDILAWGGGALSMIAAFHTALTIRFIIDPNYRPTINLRLILLGLLFGVVDVMTASMLIRIYPSFGTMNVIGKTVTLLAFPSIISPFLIWWTLWKQKREHLANIAGLFFASPYIVLVIALWLFAFGIRF